MNEKVIIRKTPSEEPLLEKKFEYKNTIFDTLEGNLKERILHAVDIIKNDLDVLGTYVHIQNKNSNTTQRMIIPRIILEFCKKTMHSFRKE